MMAVEMPISAMFSNPTVNCMVVTRPLSVSPKYSKNILREKRLSPSIIK